MHCNVAFRSALYKGIEETLMNNFQPEEDWSNSSLEKVDRRRATHNIRQFCAIGYLNHSDDPKIYQ